jgi:methyl-accepting chemotaxis protein
MEKKMSTQTRFILTGCAVFAALVLATFGVIHWFVAPDLTALESRVVANEVDQIGVRIREQLLQVEAQARSITQVAAAGDPVQVDALLGPLVDQYGDPSVIGGGIWPLPGKREAGRDKFSTFVVRGADGKLVPDTFWNSSAAPDYWEQPWYKNAENAPRGHCIWAKAYNNAASPIPRTNCDMGIYRDGQLYGAVTVNVTLGFFSQLVAEMEQQIHGQILILEADGKIVSNSSRIRSNILLKNVSDLASTVPMAAEIGRRLPALNGHEITGEFEAGGESRTLFLKPIPGSPWLIAASVPTASLSANTHRILTHLASVQIPMIAALFAFMVWGMRALMSRLDALRERIDALSSGEADLTRRLPETGGTEFAAVAASFNRFVARLQDVVSKVMASTRSVATASSEIASGNLDLSSRTEEQAASLQETAASMTQLTEAVKQNAEHTRRADTLAGEATGIASRGNTAMSEMVETIGRISASSTRISEITGLIEGIAFQTNILALNAAVEAARAGDQGRGFAVVASEVRTLAQRSASAAKEIKALVDSSAAVIQTGEQQGAQVRETIGQVQQAISKVSQIIGEIAVASDEQSRGIEQVNRAVAQMDEVTQHNAALVEQAVASAQSLDEQAALLSSTMSEFRL